MEKIKQYYKIIILFFISLIFIILIFLFNYFANQKIQETKKEEVVKEIPEKKKVIKTNNSIKYVYVDIKGAVINPGVYKVEDGKRIIDVINMAGGLREDADTSINNLSKKVKDEMFIIIYTTNEIEDYKNKLMYIEEINKELEKEIICPDNINDSCINNSNSNEMKKEEESKLISINTATKEELMSISGIGESKADEIIKYREENGKFEKIEDITNVSGIGNSLYEKIKDYITV